MQTFVPYPDIERSVRALDDRRCWKQVVEAWQILRALDNPLNRWNAHPAVNMWRRHKNALRAYYNAALAESLRRGVRTGMKPLRVRRPVRMPPWWGGPIHRSHRSNLLRKDPAFYGRYRWKVPPDLPYVWPTGRPTSPVPRSGSVRGSDRGTSGPRRG